MKIYINGCSGIIEPVDMHGNQIQIGDHLSWDYGDPYYQESGVKDWMKTPIYEVVNHAGGKGLCAVGINKKLYLHDFRFKFCVVFPKGSESKPLVTAEESFPLDIQMI